MSKISKLNVLRKVTAGVLAGTLATSAAACGKKDIEKEEKQGTSITIEEDTTKKKSNIETTVENMIEGKTTGENNGNSNTGYDYSDPGYEYTEYADPTEEYTEGQTEVKTEGKTEAKTEAKTEGKTESTKVQSPLEHRVGNASPEKHTDSTTQKPSQHTTVKTTTVKNTGVKITTTTKKVTTAKPTTKKVTTTTAKPTTQKPTEPPTTQPPAPVYDYTLENITQSAEVFNYFAEQMNDDIFRGSNMMITGFDGESNSYNGEIESKIALLLLNENANYRDGVLREVFSGYNDISIRDGVAYFYHAPIVEEACEGYADFTKYALDKNVGKYMNKIQDAMKNDLMTGDYSETDRILEDILCNGQYDYAVNNIASLYYSLGVGCNCIGSNYNSSCTAFVEDGNFSGLQIEAENKVKELTKR